MLAPAEGSAGALVDGSEPAGADVAAGAGAQLEGCTFLLWLGREPLCGLGVEDDVWAGFDAEGWDCSVGFCCWAFP